MQAQFRHNMDELNALMSRSHVNHHLRKRLREYFHRARHLQESDSASHLLGLMSPMLQSELVLDSNQRLVHGVWFLQNEVIEPQFLVHLTLQLSPLVLAPFELYALASLARLHVTRRAAHATRRVFGAELTLQHAYTSLS